MLINTLPDTLESAAQEAAANWQSFDSFSWWGRDEDTIPDPENWTIYHTAHRDSDIVDRCNAQEIEKLLQEFVDADEPTVVSTTFSHWAVGWIDALIIRVYAPDGTITPAFSALYDALCSLQDYPVLNDEALSELEYDETQESWSSYGRSDFEDSLLELLSERFDDEGGTFAPRSDHHCDHTGKPLMVCACGRCNEYSADDYDERTANISADAIDHIWELLRDQLNWEYEFDNGGCRFNIDGAVRLLSSWDTADIWYTLENAAESSAS